MNLTHFLAAARPRPEPQTQVAVLDRIAHALQEDQACLGAAVAGSLAAGTADRLSDIDLVVFCAAGTSGALLAKLRSVAETQEVLFKLCGTHDGASPYEKTILFNLCSYEFHMIEPGTMFTLKAPYLEVVNREGLLESRFSSAKPPTHEEQAPYLSGDDGLAWELFNCIKWLRRGQSEQARRYITRLAGAFPGTKTNEA
jgi:predicted nucleotidyltransferase